MQKELSGAMNCPVTERTEAGESKRSGSQRMVKVITYQCYEWPSDM